MDRVSLCYSTVDRPCSGGLLWTRPDLIFSRNMSEVLVNAGRSEEYNVHRWSFAEQRTIPLDFNKLLFLYPTWRKRDRLVAEESPGLSPAQLNRWRVADVFAWVPGRLLLRPPGAGGGSPTTTAAHGPATPVPAVARGPAATVVPPPEQTHLSDRSFPLTNVLRSHFAFALFPNRKWVEENVGWFVLNSQHDSDTAKDWNPLYRMAGRAKMDPYRPERDAPDREVEQRMRDIAVGFGE